MARKKTEYLERFRALPNTLTENTEYKGKWKSDWFKNDHPLVLEIGCGRGDLTLKLAALFPGKNYTGCDLKSPRMYRGAQNAFDAGQANVLFHRMDCANVPQYYEREVDELWITFPDPYPKDRHEKRRLTHKVFLDQYRKVLVENGIVKFKTDNRPLFDWTLEHFKEIEQAYDNLTFDLHQSELANEERCATTVYERKFMEEGKPICYMEFHLG